MIPDTASYIVNDVAPSLCYAAPLFKRKGYIGCSEHEMNMSIR